jgi:hypothetical protein
VLFTGDLLWRKVSPNLIDGSVKEWAATDLAFAQMADAEHLAYVPGHGAVANVQDVRDFRAYLLELQQLVSDGRKAGFSGDGLVAAILPKLRVHFPDWSISDRAAASEIRYMDEELAGTKRRPVPEPD